MKKQFKNHEELCRCLQSDVDAILSEVGHLFDSIADSAHEGDPLHQLDIDLVLSYPAKAQDAPSAPDAIQTDKNVSHAAKKVVRSMPKELQDEVRIYKHSTLRRRQRLGSPVNALFKRQER